MQKEEPHSIVEVEPRGCSVVNVRVSVILSVVYNFCFGNKGPGLQQSVKTWGSRVGED